MATEKLKRHKSPCTNYISAYVIQAGNSTILSENHKSLYAICKREELPWSVEGGYKKSGKADCSNYREISHSSTTLKSYLTSSFQD